MPLALLLTALLFGHLPLLLRLAESTWQQEAYRFAFLLAPAACWIGWERLRDTRGLVWPRIGPSAHAGAFWVVAVVFALIASYFWSRWINAVAALLTVMVFAHTVGGARLLRILLPPLVLLLVAVPPPLSTGSRLMSLLREWAVTGAQCLLDLAGILSHRKGQLIEIPGKQLLIEEACSGINSFMAIVAVTLFGGVYFRRTVGRTTALLLVAVGVVIAMNVARIAGGAALYVGWGIDLFSGTAHELASFVIFSLAMVIICSADRLFDYVVGVDASPPQRPPPNVPPREHGRAGVQQRIRLAPWLWGVAAAYVICGLIQIRQGNAAGAWRSYWVTAPTLGDDAAFDLPEQLAGWTRTVASDRLKGGLQTVGRRSHIWYYRDGPLTAAVAIDYPFRGFHDVKVCYTGQGWGFEPDAAMAVPGEGVHASRMTSPPLRGFVCFAVCDDQGRWLSAADRQRHLTVTGRLRGPDPEPAISYQMQAFIQSYSTLSADDERRVGELFQAAREALRRQLLEQLKRR